MEHDKEKGKIDDLVNQHIGLVKALVRRWSQGREDEDLVQVGVIGLIKAVNGFEPERGYAFSTYAVPVIIGEIKEYFRKNTLIKVSRDTNKKAKLLEEKRKELILKNKREPSMEELSKELNMSKEELIFIHESCNSPISLQQPVSKDPELSAPLENILTTNASDNIFEKIYLKEAISSLPKIEKQIIILRYFKDKTQVETAKMLELTQVQVSRIEKKTLTKLKDILN